MQESNAHDEGLAACVEHKDHGSKLCAELGPQGLACLEASSRTFQTVVQAVVARENLRLLDCALAAAQVSTAKQQQQHKQAVWWLAALLLRKAPYTAADVAERLVNLPAVLAACIASKAPVVCWRLPAAAAAAARW